MNNVWIQRGVTLLLALVIAVPLFIWYGCRIEPGNGEIAVLLRKTGTPLKEGEIIASSPGQQGIQLEVLGEGRYFRNPYVWEWMIFPVTDVPAGKFAVLVRKYGSEPANGGIIADKADSKGIIREVLGTGKHRINPFAYEVRIFDDIIIPPGNVGVVVELTGGDLFSGVSNDNSIEQGFISVPGRKGVQKKVLKEGTHRLNPFLYSVSLVNIQSQRHEFSGNDAINFLTLDGFTVSLEGTVEFNIDPGMAPRLAHEVGDMEDILKKLILPSVRGFARIEGSKNGAVEFIIGESRQNFQTRLETFLRNNCRKWGVMVNSVLIRDIIVPQEIAAIIRDRELAKQEARKYGEQISQARSEAELQKQRMLAEQNSRRIAAETESKTAAIAASQQQLEARIAAETALHVAEVDFKTAEAQARARLNAAEAERRIAAERISKEVSVLAGEISAFGNGENYVQSAMYKKLLPGVRMLIFNGTGGFLSGAFPDAGAKISGGAK